MRKMSAEPRGWVMRWVSGLMGGLGLCKSDKRIEARAVEWKSLPSGGWAIESGNRRATLHKRVSGVYPWVVERLTRITGEPKWIPVKPLMTFMDEPKAREFGENFVMSWRERHGAD